jgi:hypothetical protein
VPAPHRQPGTGALWRPDDEDDEGEDGEDGEDVKTSPLEHPTTSTVPVADDTVYHGRPRRAGPARVIGPGEDRLCRSIRWVTLSREIDELASIADGLVRRVGRCYRCNPTACIP